MAIVIDENITTKKDDAYFAVGNKKNDYVMMLMIYLIGFYMHQH